MAQYLIRVIRQSEQVDRLELDENELFQVVSLARATNSLGLTSEGTKTQVFVWSYGDDGELADELADGVMPTW